MKTNVFLRAYVRKAGHTHNGWISEKIRVCQYPFVPIFKGIFQSQYSHFQFIYCKGMVSKSKYWISKNNKGNEYSKTPKNP